MDWTLKENRVGRFFHCATLTGGSWCHTTFAQVGAETSDTQNRRQKVYTRGTLRLCWGGLTL